MWASIGTLKAFLCSPLGSDMTLFCISENDAIKIHAIGSSTQPSVILLNVIDTFGQNKYLPTEELR